MTTANKLNTRLAVLSGIIFVAIVSRITIPSVLGHSYNFSPIDAIALFSGCYFSKKWMSAAITILSVMLGDLVLSRIMGGVWTVFYPGFYFQYASYILIVLIRAFLSKKLTSVNMLVACLSSSILFFIVSNF